MRTNEKIEPSGPERRDKSDTSDKSVSILIEENLGVETRIKKHFLNGERLKKMKTIAAPFRLLLALVIYTAIGGLVFRELELPSELERSRRFRRSIRDQRHRLIGSILNNTDVSNLASLIKYELGNYERIVQEATRAGLELRSLHRSYESGGFSENTKDADRHERWSVLQAVFFASTVLTTIGYGNVVPSTNWGRIFCIVFAFGGIPLTLTVIADWGKLFAEAVSSIAVQITSKLPAATISWIPSNHAGRRSLGAFAAAVLLCLYLACGAAMFTLWEDDWGFFDGFYFCFVTMTTIGFGDLVPKKPKYMLLCTVYILVGLALTGTIIELVRRQYAQSWQRLQALRAPLAETLKRLGEHAGGVDISALHSDIRRVLTVISMPRLGRASSSDEPAGKARKHHEWEETVEAVLRDIVRSTPPAPPEKPILQIVIYESSV